VAATAVGPTSATITWQTNNASNSRVDYGTTTAYGGLASDAASLTSHSLTLSGLSSNTTYHYKVTSVDASAQSASSVDATFTTTTPPLLQISSVVATGVGPTSATITWQTNNASNSRVDYGTTTAYGSVATNASAVTGHSLALPSLTPNTTYHYKVTSLDAFAQSAASADATFTTTASVPNMVTNPGFESGAASWDLATTAVIDTVAANAHSGTASLRMAATAAWQGNWQSFAVTPGSTYTFSGWERSTTSGAYLSVFSYDLNWVQLDQGTHLVFPGTGAWTSRSGSYVAPPRTAYALLGLQNSVVGTYWFDDVSMTTP
jgi:hypothetical protein